MKKTQRHMEIAIADVILIKREDNIGVNGTLMSLRNYTKGRIT